MKVFVNRSQGWNNTFRDWVVSSGWCGYIQGAGQRIPVLLGKRGKLICGFLISAISNQYMQDVLGSGAYSCIFQHFLYFWIQGISVPCQTQQGLPSAGTLWKIQQWITEVGVAEGSCEGWTNSATVPRPSSTALIPVGALSRICWLQELGAVNTIEFSFSLHVLRRVWEVSGWELCTGFPQDIVWPVQCLWHCCGVQWLQHWPSGALLG